MCRRESYHRLECSYRDGHRDLALIEVERLRPQCRVVLCGPLHAVLLNLGCLLGLREGDVLLEEVTRQDLKRRCLGSRVPA